MWTGDVTGGIINQPLPLTYDVTRVSSFNIFLNFAHVTFLMNF